MTCFSRGVVWKSIDESRVGITGRAYTMVFG
jgi:hypothetical protein